MKIQYDQLVISSGQKTVSLLESETDNKNLREALGQLQCSSSAREEFLITESSKVKEEVAAEIEKCSMMKSRYDQLVLTSESSLARERDLTSELLSVKAELTVEAENSSVLKRRYDQLVLSSGQKISRLNKAVESCKAETAAETLKLEKSREREKSLSDEGVKLHEELKDTKATSNINHEDAKNSQAKALKTLKENHTQRVNSLDNRLKSMKENHTSRVNTLEASIKNKKRDVSKLQERVRVLDEEKETLRSTISLLKTPSHYESPLALTPPGLPPSTMATPSTPTPLSPSRLSSHTSSSLDGDWQEGKLSLKDCKIDYTQLYYNLQQENLHDLPESFCTHGPEHKSVDSTFCDILDNHCKDVYGEPDEEGCACGNDTYGERFYWCTICKDVFDDLSDSDGSSSDISSNTSPSPNGLLCTCRWRCNSCGIIHEDMPPGHEDDSGNRNHGERRPGVTIPDCTDGKWNSCGIIHKDMPPGHEGHDDDGHKDDSGNYGECRPGVTIPYNCKVCLNASCKCKWKCDCCGVITDVDGISGCMKADHLRENGEKCVEYRPGVTFPYICSRYKERINYLQYLSNL